MKDETPDQTNYAGGTQRDWALAGCGIAPRTKRQFAQRYAAGEFGNKPRTWQSVAAVVECGYDGLVNARSRTTGGRFVYGIPAQSLVDGWPFDQPESAFYFNETMPDDRLVLQGEVSITDRGMMLVYSVEPGLTMRQALAACAPRHAYGSAAMAVMQDRLWPASYDDIGQLLEKYPEAVIEFSAYDCAVGDCPNRNAVIWEVRGY